MEYLKQTLTTCIEYYEKQGNKEKVKEIKKKIKNLKKNDYL